MQLHEAIRTVNAALPSITVPFRGETLLCICHAPQVRRQLAVRQLVKDAQASWGLERIDVRRGIEGLLGMLEHRHALRADRTLLAEQTEPQLISSLTQFLRGRGDGALSRQRVRDFLQALLKGQVIKSMERPIDELVQATALTIHCELAVKKQRRIDLLLSWDMPNGLHYTVAVEAKFNHQVSKDQLPAYQRYVQSQSPPGQYALVLLTRDGKRHRWNSTWLTVAWWQLMWRWEPLLSAEKAEDDSMLFDAIRRVIWDKM